MKNEKLIKIYKKGNRYFYKTNKGLFEYRIILDYENGEQKQLVGLPQKMVERNIKNLILSDEKG